MDDRVRFAERHAAAEGTDEAHADVLRAKLRAGTLTQDQLDLLVWVGYIPAWIVQDNWIHSDHIAGICPCPGCWKGGYPGDWVQEIHKRWGEEPTRIALGAALTEFLEAVSISATLLHADDIKDWKNKHRKLWRTVFDEQFGYLLLDQLRENIETALKNYVLGIDDADDSEDEEDEEE